ncbi:MAG: hypothetical protein MI919_18850 [Holophagales bacterium]|nr:hypothetical protein [Holophagales bacterium]
MLAARDARWPEGRRQALAETGTTPARPSVQRFTVVQPQDYLLAGQSAGAFRSQQLDTSRTSEIPYSHLQITQNLRWADRYADNPPLKISSHGRLALESTVGQPKAFYAEPGDVEKNRQKLIDIGSRVTLEANPQTRLTVPANPANIDDRSNELVQVRPEKSPGLDPDEALMNADECDSVSQKIVHGKEMIVGSSREGFETLGPVSARRGQINRLGKAVTAMQGGDSLADFARSYGDLGRDAPNLFDSSLPISTEVRSYFAPGFFRRSHLVPEDQVLRALSVPGVPRELWRQVYELHVGKTEDQRPFRPALINHIQKFLSVRDTAEYEKVRGQNNRHARLGINQHASPQVGESFSAVALASPTLVDEHGSQVGDVSFTGRGQEAIQGVLGGMLEIGQREHSLGVVAQEQFRKARGIVPYQEHHAAVVGKDGDDTVTFENYNRTVEADTLQLGMWDDLFEEFEKFDRNIKAEVRQIREGIATAKERPDLDPRQKYSRILQQKKQHLELLRQQLLVVQDFVGLKLESNLDEESFEQWHFNMYGPSNATFVDEKGDTKPQSFHETWSPSVSNALTVRTTSIADEEFKAGAIRKIEARVGQVAFHLLRKNGFRFPASTVETIFDTLTKPIRDAGTRVEVADALQATRERLEKLEDFPELEGEEERQARLLIDKDYSGIAREALRTLQAARLERQREEQYAAYERSPAFGQPELSKKYGAWRAEAAEKAGRLERKRDFFLAFAKLGKQ